MSRESSRPRRVAQLLDEAWGISASQPERELSFTGSQWREGDNTQRDVVIVFGWRQWPLVGGVPRDRSGQRDRSGHSGDCLARERQLTLPNVKCRRQTRPPRQQEFEMGIGPHVDLGSLVGGVVLLDPGDRVRGEATARGDDQDMNGRWLP
jgi:hypothetical protein